MNHRSIFTALLVLCAAATVSAHPDVNAGKAAFLKGEYRPALARLEEAERSPNVTEEDLVNIHWYRGASFYALGKKEDANKSFDARLAVRPLFAPNKLDTPPDVRGAFKKRADAYQKAHGVTLGAPAFEAAQLKVPLDGNIGEAAAMLVYARAAGEKTYRKFDFPISDAKATGVLNQQGLWERSGKAGKMELVIEVMNQRGTPIARTGDALKPLSVPVTEEQAGAAVAAMQTPPPQPEKDPPPADPVASPTKDPPPSKDPPPAKDPPPKDEPQASGGGPLPAVLGAAGAGFLVVGALGVLGVLAAGAGSAASWGGFAYVHSEVIKLGAQVTPNYPLYAQLYLPLQIAGYALAGVAGVGGLTALLLGGAGIVILILRAVLA